ncbi:GTP-binding protein [Eubacteriaceae bacterium ES3]|nr:GTP-binding protein [Eubacteriaceae bacterium ES3]
MKIIIFGGFLGSGKTSVVVQLAKHLIGDNPENLTKVVILENEIGDVGIDDKLLKSSGYEVENLFSGCVCCTLSGELVLGIHKIKNDFNPDTIILEATGVAFPDNIRETILKSMPDIDCRVICVTDAKRWMRLLKPMEMLLNDQLKAADAILLNKVNLVDQAKVLQVVESIRTFNNAAVLYKINALETIHPEIIENIAR